MCIIVDTNCLGGFLKKRDKDMEPVWKWLEDKNGKLAYAPIPKIKKEWWEPHRQKLQSLKASGKLKEADKGKVMAEMCKIKKWPGGIQSDDHHILALARVANVTVLVSKDNDLRKDFQNRDIISGGKIYQKASHQHLLTPDLCP